MLWILASDLLTFAVVKAIKSRSNGVKDPVGSKVNSDLLSKVSEIAEQVYQDIGIGFAESIYKEGLALRLRQAGISYVQERTADVMLDNEKIGYVKLDFLVEEVLVIECKNNGYQSNPGAEAQLSAYLRSVNLPMGLFINFGSQNNFAAQEIQSK